ncbi:hypothetical protein AK830_g1302 [Neonectria ditissima]|uniref:Galactosyl transferase GMA12/MNN10 family protein n=1 Tax=Neonectria ditissima TaxID=78410 RepID=A0A0P7B6E3_9HYPO|nr:hypothetical protein AK830_g1302 [Neonectria ditissima]
MTNSLPLKLAAGVVVFFFLQVAILEHWLSLRFPLLNQDAPAKDVELSRKVLDIQHHGGNDCFESITPALLNRSETIRESCMNSPSPFKQTNFRMATLMAHFGKPESHYQRAMQTHMMLGAVHNYPLHVMCRPIIDDLWNKPAFILSVILDEMAKPPDERLQWLLWADRDTVILDYCRHPTSFLLPQADSSATTRSAKGNPTHLLVSNDWNGLNNGVFLVHVDQWSIELFSDILAFRHFRPDVKLRFTEQSAMEIIIKEDKYKSGVQYVPQHWFNAYPEGVADELISRANTTGLPERAARRGDFLVHFAGNGDKGRAINEWLDTSSRVGNVWQTGRVQRDVTEEVVEFWVDAQLK